MKRRRGRDRVHPVERVRDVDDALLLADRGDRVRERHAAGDLLAEEQADHLAVAVGLHLLARDHDQLAAAGELDRLERAREHVVVGDRDRAEPLVLRVRHEARRARSSSRASGSCACGGRRRSSRGRRAARSPAGATGAGGAARRRTCLRAVSATCWNPWSATSARAAAASRSRAASSSAKRSSAAAASSGCAATSGRRDDRAAAPRRPRPQAGAARRGTGRRSPRDRRSSARASPRTARPDVDAVAEAERDRRPGGEPRGPRSRIASQPGDPAQGAQRCADDGQAAGRALDHDQPALRLGREQRRGRHPHRTSV